MAKFAHSNSIQLRATRHNSILPDVEEERDQSKGHIPQREWEGESTCISGGDRGQWLYNEDTSKGLLQVMTPYNRLHAIKVAQKKE